MSLKGTETAKNLLASFAGESQARNRYTYYASVAKKQGYLQIAEIFLETAEQEKEHAKRFFKFLAEDYKDEAIEITASYPVSLSTETVDNLKSAAAGENEEWTDLYPKFAEIARKEGFQDVALAYDNISKVENFHEKRYRKLVESIEKGQVFEKDEAVLWKCSNCGFIYEGKKAPLKCPACLHDQKYFRILEENY
ncbi:MULTISPECIES: rubrerythrin [unclassified Clostridium]|uniref:rubrerythrin n=1 Tax=unclassified Clostridium TaxID=2614128 RepID=UPI001EEB3BEE|nr:MULTISPECIES: rubrerythrin family protein [unclassified Clostridium]MDD7792881.1 rubrerythrin family protein [Clostridium sp. 'White wine YQ']